MAMRTVYGTQAAGAQVPGSTLDAIFLDIFQLGGTTQCTATGTNAISLTPVANQAVVTTPLPANGQMFSWVAAATSTGSITVAVNAGTAVPLFLPGGTVQAGANNVLQGNPYLTMFLTALNSGGGGHVIIGAQPGTITVPRSYLAGMTLSNDGVSPNTVLDISAGQATDSTNSAVINLGAFTTSTGGAWTAGTGNNGMGNGLTIANTAWYHVFAIINAGLADAYFDTSVTAANKPASTTAFRRIGSFLTNGAAQIIAFVQFGDYFYWKAEVQDQNTTLATTAANFTVSVPLGVQTLWLGHGFSGSASTSTGLRFFSPSQSDQAIDPTGDAYASFGATAVGSTSVRVGGNVMGVLTNTSSQIRAVSGANGTSFVLTTEGWIDYRGRFS